jgi:hypothetical protein
MKKCIICQQQIQKKIVFNRETGQILNVVDTSLASNIRKDLKGAPESVVEVQAKEQLQKLDVIKKIVANSGGPGHGSAGNTVERLRYLESKIMEIEEANSCGICMERVRNVVFLCGHGACCNCAQTLKTCHMCRKTITKKINIY